MAWYRAYDSSDALSADEAVRAIRDARHVYTLMGQPRASNTVVGQLARRMLGLKGGRHPAKAETLGSIPEEKSGNW